MQLFILFWLVFFSSRTGHGTPPQTPLQIEDAMGVRALAGQAPIALSPDGAWVAYTVQDERKRQGTNAERYMDYAPTGTPTQAVGCDIWITNTKTGESRNLTKGKGTSWAPVWSPDGKHVAFYSDRSGIARLWIWDTATGNMRQLSDAIVRPFFNFQVVRWTPDSRKIVLRVLPEGMTVEQAADLIISSTSKTYAQKPNSTGPTVTVYTSSTPALGSPTPTDSRIVEDERWRHRYLSDLALVDEATGNIDRIVKKVRPLGYWISPDGKHLAYTDGRGTAANTLQAVSELVLFTFAGKSVRSLVPNIEEAFGISVSWSPDSRSLAYITGSQNAKGDCFVVSIRGGSPQILTEGKHPPFDHDFRAPLWDTNGEYIYLIRSEKYGRLGTDTVWKVSVRDRSYSIAAKVPGRVILEVVGPSSGGRVWSPDGGHSIVVRTRDENTKQVGFYRVGVSNGQSTKLFEENSYFAYDMIFGQDVSRDGQTVAYVAQDAQHPEDIWITNSGFAGRQRITKINPDLKDLAFGASRVINWRSLDGTQLHGVLLLPANYQEGEKYPLVVTVYGGSYLSENAYRFGLYGSGVDNLQLLATRGYAVLLPDTPLHDGTPMLELLKMALPGVDRVVELGIADPDRLGVMGHSYGGYSTISLIVQTNRFKAAVSIAGIADLISGYGQMDKSGASWAIIWSETGQGGMRGTPWQFRDRYIENSPIFYLDRVQTPLLIIHGELDRAVSCQQAEEVFVGLRRLGKEVEYARYEGEGHVPSHWKYANQVDFWNRMIAWFDKYLKAAQPPN